jgi:hypothetical protein
MQTSGNGSSSSRLADGQTSRVAGVGLVVGLIALSVSGWMACSPGEIVCEDKKVMIGCPDNGGAGGTGGVTPNTEDPGCMALGIKSAAEVESKFIAPKCGASGCHQAIFPPRNLNNVSMIKSAMVGKKAMVLCKTDSYVDTTDPSKSFILAKVKAMGDTVVCPSGGKADSGGSRMPNKVGAPAGTVGDPLTDDEVSCLTWWVNQQVAK